tara:strand:+ start:514 stop:636 length:123 start_codon:yes stop_codon:yes gene_type:complete
MSRLSLPVKTAYEIVINGCKYINAPTVAAGRFFKAYIFNK